MINELEPTPSADPIPAVVQPFKNSVILSSSQGQTLMNWLKNTPGFCTESLEMVGLLPTFTPVVITKGKQLQ